MNRALRHSAALRDRVAAVMATRTSDEWLRFFLERGINVSRLAHLEDMRTDEQAIANGVLATPREDIGVPYVINAPVFVDGRDPCRPETAPRKSASIRTKCCQNSATKRKRLRRGVRRGRSDATTPRRRRDPWCDRTE